MSDVKEIIARRAARELHDGDIVNLGIGLPKMPFSDCRMTSMSESR